MNSISETVNDGGEHCAKHQVWKYSQTIKGDPAQVFPLLCPVREAEWLDGWRYQLVYSDSGLAELGCVFTTPGDGESDTVWIITRHEPDRGVIEFARFTQDSRVCRLEVVVSSAGQGASTVDICYTYTAITEAGNRFLDKFTETDFLGAVKFWEKSMNHFLTHGEKLTPE